MAKRSKNKRGSSPVSRSAHSMVGGVLDWSLVFRVVLLMATAIWIFWPTLHGDWISDDTLYITDNPLLRDPWRIWKAWFVPGSFVDYYPLHETAQWIQWQLWGRDTLGYHVSNIVLHIVSALLLWRLLSKLGLRLAWLGGLLFIVHPMMVESVAWISEFKNTLSLPPFLVAMSYWIDYEDHKKIRDYRLALGWFLAAMLCKISMAPFPVVILLYAWWKRDRIEWNDLKASAPFFIISLILGMATIVAGKLYLPPTLDHLPAEYGAPVGDIFSRLALIGTVAAFYFASCIVPLWPSTAYYQWSVNPPSIGLVLPWLVLVGVFCILWYKRQSWGRNVLLGLGFFFLLLAPFLGFLTISFMICTWVYSHFLYIPIIGLIGLVVAVLGHLEELVSQRVRNCGTGLIALVLAAMAWESHTYAGYWIDQQTLCEHDLTLNPQSWFAHNDVGSFLDRKGHHAEAITEFELSLRLHPHYLKSQYNLATALLETGQIPEAMTQLRQILEISPHYASARYNLGNALLQRGQTSQAIEQFEETLKTDPKHPKAHNDIGVALLRSGHMPEAIEQFKQELLISPFSLSTRGNLADALVRTGAMDEALVQFQEMVRLDPNNAEAYVNFGSALLQTGNASEAIGSFEQALQLNPAIVLAHYNLALALLKTNRIPEAKAQIQEALQLDPQDMDAQNLLAQLNK